MKTRISEEKIKPFRLVKYFTFTSLIFISLGILVLSLLNTHWAKTMQLRKSQEYARLLIENLNHQVFSQFILPMALKHRGKVHLSDKNQFEVMDKVVRGTLHSFNVEMVNIYNKNGTIIYSFDTEFLGMKDVGKGYEEAVSGRLRSNMVQSGSWLEIFLGISKDSRIITFAPLHAEKPLSADTGPVLGVVEIIQNISDDYREIFKFQIFVSITSTIVMGILLIVLILVVKRGEGIIQRRAQEQLRLQELLDRADHLSSIGKMVAGISHEIRNPLGIISSSAELLKKKMSGTDPVNAIPNIIVEEANRLNNIITDFLKFAKPADPKLTPCRLDDLMEKNINSLLPQIKKLNYVIDKYYEENLPEIPFDPDMLYQAFLNIMLNAMQAMPRGGTIQIRISSARTSILVFIEDIGQGIPEELMEKIWNPFFTTKEKGTGLGLGIVKNIIELHNGSIRIENRRKRGVRVIIELPADHAPDNHKIMIVNQRTKNGDMNGNSSYS
jgi:two-component system, NtrC family, sensor histidine kinase HydH